MAESKEWKRGYKASKETFSRFRSFKKRDDGTWIGYKKTGSTEVIGDLADFNGRDDFSKGWNVAMKEAIKNNPVRKRKSSASKKKLVDWSGFSMK